MVIRYPGRIREFETNAYIICIIIIRISHTEQLIINHCATARRRRAPGTSGSGGARPNIPSPPRLPNPTLPRRCSTEYRTYRVQASYNRAAIGTLLHGARCVCDRSPTLSRTRRQWATAVSQCPFSRAARHALVLCSLNLYYLNNSVYCKTHSLL